MPWVARRSMFGVWNIRFLLESFPEIIAAEVPFQAWSSARMKTMLGGLADAQPIPRHKRAKYLRVFMISGHLQVRLGVPALLPAGFLDLRAEEDRVVEIEILGPDEFGSGEIRFVKRLFRVHALFGVF